MPVWDVMVHWEETGATEREFRVTAPTKKAAAEKATERFRSHYSRVPQHVEYHLAEEGAQKRHMRHPAIVNMDPVQNVAYRDKIDRTNEPGTCLWCGLKLRRSSSWPERVGHYGDNAFCGHRCGYEFGVMAAVLGFRLKPRKDESE
jgi:hypothetical protein